MMFDLYKELTYKLGRIFCFSSSIYPTMLFCNLYGLYTCVQPLYYTRFCAHAMYYYSNISNLKNKNKNKMISNIAVKSLITLAI